MSKQRSEALDPAVDGGVVDVNAALGGELLVERGTTTRSADTEHREDDHLGREAEAIEADPAMEGGGGGEGSWP